MTFFLFPWMHVESLGFQLPDQVHLLDPGARQARTGRAAFFRPPHLPLSEDETRKVIQQVLDLGGQFKHVHEVGSLARASREDFFSQTSMGVRSDFSRYAHGRQDDQEGLSRQAQMMLLLFWALEESLLEFSSLEERVDTLWQSYGQVLGLNGQGASPGRPEQGSEGLNIETVLTGSFTWDKLLPWFLYFLPDHGRLLVVDAQIQESWLEAGLSSRPISRADLAGLGGWAPDELDRGAAVLTAPGWQLCLMQGPQEGRPWLAREVTAVSCPGGHDHGEGRV